jgi:Leucine-rich repeat (LRR) protein
MEHLSELYLENNQLTKLPDFSKLHSLEVLNLKNNKLTTVAKPLKKLKYLRKLDLRGNKIPENEIEKLKKCMVDCEILY